MAARLDSYCCAAHTPQQEPYLKYIVAAVTAGGGGSSGGQARLIMFYFCGPSLMQFKVYGHKTAVTVILWWLRR